MFPNSVYYLSSYSTVLHHMTVEARNSGPRPKLQPHILLFPSPFYLYGGATQNYCFLTLMIVVPHLFGLTSVIIPV